jgi:hypothetical protein
MSREPDMKAKNAYDYRRYITLVQVLATGDGRKVVALCEAWGVEPVASETVTISRLAQHAVEYHRKEHAQPPHPDERAGA